MSGRRSIVRLAHQLLPPAHRLASLALKKMPELGFLGKKDLP